VTSPPPKLREHRLRRRARSERRAERDELGFLRQPMVRWLAPSVFAKTGLVTGLATLFGKFADKREARVYSQGVFDYSEHDELWIDYLSDTGDGFEPTYAMARLLAEEELEPEGAPRPLRRGHVLLLGGDEVYPFATPDAYEDRFVGPFGAALPEGATDPPRIFALPGNHDWYDGLTTFLRVFAQSGSVGAWQKRQHRSYFALKLPHRWWVWAIDIQLDTYLDKGQLDYFKSVAETRLEPGDRVILLTAKPSWVKPTEARVEPRSWRNLAYFEQKMIREKGGRLELTLTGDLHHYSRYEPEDREWVKGGLPTRITAGGGGAYLYPTHLLPEAVPLKTWLDQPAVTYRREEVYPDVKRSERLKWGALLLLLRNPSFGLITALVYAVLAAIMLAAFNVPPARSLELWDVLSGGATPYAVLLLLVLLAIYADFSDVKSRARRWLGKVGAGAFHAALHALAAGAAIWLIGAHLGAALGLVGFRIAGLGTAFAVGYLLGSFIYALVLLALHVLVGEGAPAHANEVFASQQIKDYKNFLRLHIQGDGRLTVYPIGVDHLPRRWSYQARDAGRRRPDGPWFKPVDGETEARLIDGPLHFPPELDTGDGGQRGP